MASFEKLTNQTKATKRSNITFYNYKESLLFNDKTVVLYLAGFEAEVHDLDQDQHSV